MASLKIKYRQSSIEGKAGTLFYQVIHKRIARQISSGYKIYPDEWDISNSQIIIPTGIEENRYRYLVSIRQTRSLNIIPPFPRMNILYASVRISLDN